MLKDFLEKIEAMAAARLHTIHGRDYVDGEVKLVVPPVLVQPFDVHTLAGLAQAIRAGLDGLDVGEWIVHVRDHASVQVMGRETDDYGRRETLLRVTLKDVETFPFGRFIDREEFVIGLLSRFVPDPSLDEIVKLASTLTAERVDPGLIPHWHHQVVKLASTLTAERVELSEDDGISQRTTVRQGVTLDDKVTVKRRVLLRPYRTFREVEQPASEFVFRLRSVDGEVPTCALFEADGGAWKIDAATTIKTWLDAQQLNMPVVL